MLASRLKHSLADSMACVTEHSFLIWGNVHPGQTEGAGPRGDTKGRDQVGQTRHHGV